MPVILAMQDDDHGMRPTQAKSTRPYLKNNQNKKRLGAWLNW
jgi:hypothetical protein